MSKVTGSVRVWYAEQGWGVFDSAETPGGCWADAKEVMPMEQPLDLYPGSPVRFAWMDISPLLIEGFRYRAHSFYPIDESLELDDEDYELLDLEDAVILDDEPPTSAEDFVRDSEVGVHQGAVPQRISRIELNTGADRSPVIDDDPWRQNGPLTGDFEALNDNAAAPQLVRHNPELVALIIAMNETDQRRVARWCVNKAYERSGLAVLDWVAPALSAFNRGDLNMPAPFQDLTDASARWSAEGYPSSDLYRGEIRPLSELRSPFDNDQGSLAYSALPALFRAQQSDALAAAIGALSDASHTFGPAVDELHNALMREFRKP
ncbi:hypothetical protein H351_29930 (plasmid) [Rhodococcus erythropolis R138]|uniref:hypothetical protein n=1 Tax=Rhodococcus erythropolis TaxID=1833 RepID=UPI000738F53E|nr:hypothetical protein [Rhodococcus erythropolis]ALU73312.1 hypothetical protein H351_29930 [Rhodococcus erythropolis R138]